MKKTLICLSLCGAFMALTSCKKKQIKNIKSDMTEGTWKVSKFTDDNSDETADYAGDIFTFNSDGTLVVTGTHSASGTWSIAKEDHSGDDSGGDDHLECTISLPAQLEELSDDWEIESHSDNQLELKDESGDNSVDRLTFVKI